MCIICSYCGPFFCCCYSILCYLVILSRGISKNFFFLTISYSPEHTSHLVWFLTALCVKVSFGFPTPPPAPFEPNVPSHPWVTAPPEHDHACKDEPSLPRLLHPLVGRCSPPPVRSHRPARNPPFSRSRPPLLVPSRPVRCPPGPPVGKATHVPDPLPHTSLPRAARPKTPATYYSHYATTTTFRLGQTLRARRSRFW